MKRYLLPILTLISVLFLSCTKTHQSDAKDAVKMSAARLPSYATLKLIPFAADESQRPYDTLTIRLNNTFCSCYNSGEGDKKSNTTNQDQIGALVNYDTLAFDNTRLPVINDPETIKVILYRLNYPDYGLHILASGFLTGYKAVLKDAITGKIIPINLYATNSDYFYDFHYNYATTVSNRFSVVFSKM